MKRTLLREILRICREKLARHPMWQVSEPKFHYSFIIQHNKIVAWSPNRLTESILGWGELSNLHSELATYNLAKGILDHRKKWSIVNVRLNKKGELRMSAPCKNCQRFLKVVGVDKIYFTTSTGFARMED